MTTIVEIDRQIRQLTSENSLSRPFLCTGSPLGCDVAEVGINPATDTPFWPYWSISSGFDKQRWLSDYRQRHGRLKPTRDRIEVFAKSLAPLRLLELNLYHHFSPSFKDLSREHRDTALFDYLMKIAKPRVLIVHGDKPSTHLEDLLGVVLPKSKFTSAIYQGETLQVFRSKRHFAYVSRDYVVSVAGEIKSHLQTINAWRSGSMTADILSG
jgi:hypothetical protein